MPEELRIADYEDASVYLTGPDIYNIMPSPAEQESMIEEYQNAR